MNNRPHDDWEELFDQLPVDASVREQSHQRLKAEVLSAYDDQPAVRTQRHNLKELGRTLMKYKVPHCTAAAILLAGIVWLAQTASKPAFAVDDVVDNMLQARSARFVMTVKVTGQPKQKLKALFLDPARFRQEHESGYINIADWQAGKMIGLDPKSKQATVFTLVNTPPDAKEEMQTNYFDGIRQSLRKAIDDPDTKVESLGEKELAGRTVVGFRFKTGPQPMTLWADPETRLPVRIEAIMVGPPKTEVVMSDYEFNVELDKSLFSTSIPDGYKVMETNVDVSPPTEKDFIAALRMSCERTNKFPTGFDPAAIGAYVAIYLQKEGIEKAQGPSAEQIQEVVQISRGFQFVLMLPAAADAHYAGDGAESGDAKRAIFWYKPDDSKKYRVVYADFEVKEADTAPEVPGAKKISP